MPVKKTPCIVGIGEILWDMLPSGKQLGGAPANFAFHAQALGAMGLPVSAVGDDALGNEIIELLRDYQVNDRFIAIEPDCPTGTVTVKLDASGVPDYTIHEEVAWDYIPFSEPIERLAAEADAICYGTLAQRSSVSRETIQAFIRSVHDGCLRIYDVNLRQAFYNKEILQETLIVSDVMKLNDDELPIVGDLCGVSGNEEEILAQLLTDFGLELIALTKGERGSRLFSNSSDSIVAAPKVDVVDTVGAGDAFTAALAVGLLNEFEVDRIHQMATGLAAFVCSRKGAMPMLSDSMISDLLK